ncbi:MAG: hypothetical protein QM776_13710 [Rhodocyclaceae bacterium]
MAEIICVIGIKGGTGKTTLSHMICHGLTLLGKRAACVMTDEFREPLRPEGRNYVVADARSAKAREKMMETLRGLPGWVGVLDGGANRTDTDMTLYKLSSLVLLPFRDSAEDLRAVAQDLERYPRAWALPSQWPTNHWQQDASRRLLDTLPAHLRQRVLAPTFAVSSSKLLLQARLPESLPTVLNNAARSVADMALTLINHKDRSLIDTLDSFERRQILGNTAQPQQMTRH